MAAKDFELILRVQADLQQAVSQLRTLNDQMRVTKSAAVEASGGIGKIGTSSKAAEAGIRGIGTQLTGIRGKFDGINRAAHDLRNAFVFAFAVHEVIDFTKALVDANVEAQRIQYTMEQVFGAEGAATQISFVRDLTQNLGLDFKSAAQGFATFAASAQGTGIQTSDLKKLFTGLSEAATVLHSSTEDVNGVMVQLGQAMSLGKLQMQDIRAIAQHLPGTMTALSEAANRLGINLSEALKKGGLNAKQFIGVLGDVLHDRFGVQAVAASHSLNAELNRLGNTFFQIETDGTGFADHVAKALANLNTTLNDPGIRKGLQDLIDMLGKAASVAIKAASELGGFLKYAAAVSGGANSQDLGGLSVEQQDIQAELRQRAKHPTLSAINTFLAGTENNPLQNTLEAGRPRIQSMSTEQLNARLAQIQQQINAIEHPPVSSRNPQEGDDRGLYAGLPDQGAPTKPDAAALRKAAELAKQAANAQDSLTKSLIDFQGQLDPTAAIYAKYNAAVEKATADAELAKKAKGADAAAIDSQRDAIIGLAGTIRDAALDAIAEKDRQAWEALKRSFETPAQVAVDDALKKIAQLNDLMKGGKHSAAEYHDALAKIGQSSVTQAPQYQGPGAAVGGPYGELQKNFQAQSALEAWHQEQLKANEAFRAQDTSNEEVYQARLAEIQKQYAQQSSYIEKSRQTLILGASAQFFDNIAQLSSSHNRKIAAIGKAAAIASTLIKAYQSGTEARAALSGIPIIGPALGIAAEVAAIAAGLANVAQMRSQSVGSYATGGAIRGPGTGTSDSVPILASNGEYMHTAAAVQYYGLPMMDAINKRMFPRFAEGGLIPPHPLANAPSPAALGFTAPTPLPLGNVAGSAANDDSSARQPPPPVHVFAVFDPAELADKVMNSGPGHKVIVNVAGNNPNAIKAKWGGG